LGMTPRQKSAIEQRTNRFEMVKDSSLLLHLSS
jgi:hypothetical protein